jgi:large subunit ribosomal protein L24e
MVIKTQSCFFTELKIYPGHGTQFVRRDGRLLHFINQRVQRLYHHSKKSAKLHWTQAWRRNNKKVRVEVVQKRARKRRVRLAKAVGGMSVDDIKKKMDQKTEIRRAAKEEALKAMKEKKKQAKDDKKKAQSKSAKPAKAVQPKIKVSKKGQR